VELTGWLSKAGDSLVAADRRRRRRRSAATEEEDDCVSAMLRHPAPPGGASRRSGRLRSCWTRGNGVGRPVATAAAIRGDGGARPPDLRRGERLSG
jgi:hypothetical protein